MRSFEVDGKKMKIYPKFFRRWKFYFSTVLLLHMIWIALMVILLNDSHKLKISFVKMDKWEAMDYERELKQNEPLIIAICVAISVGQMFGWAGIVKTNLLLLSIFNRICVTSTVAIICKIMIHYQNPVSYIELLFCVPVLIVTRKFITKVKIIDVFYASKL